MERDATGGFPGYSKRCGFKNSSCPFACGNVQLSLAWHISSTCMRGEPRCISHLSRRYVRSALRSTAGRSRRPRSQRQQAHVRRQRWWRPRRRPPDTNSRAPHAFKVSCGQATIGSLRSLGAVTHRPITRLPITCPPRRARAARLLATAAARPRAATLPCAPDRARAAHRRRALADRAAAAQVVAAPPRPNPPARACRCRRRRRHRRRRRLLKVFQDF